MAKINSQKFTTEEFQDQIKWIGKLFAPLNQFIGDVISGFRNGLTIEDNFYQEIKEIKWTNSAQNFPLKFRTKFVAHPKGMIPIYLLNNTTGAFSTAAPWLEWGYADGQVSIGAISGLTPNSTYTIRLLVIYG